MDAETREALLHVSDNLVIAPEPSSAPEHMTSRERLEDTIETVRALRAELKRKEKILYACQCQLEHTLAICPRDMVLADIGMPQGN